MTRSTRLQIATSGAVMVLVLGLLLSPAITPTLLDGLSFDLGPDDIAAEADGHAAHRDAVAQSKAAERQAQRFDRAAALMCGQNAGWKRIDDTTIACTTKRGQRTGQIVQVAL